MTINLKFEFQHQKPSKLELLYIIKFRYIVIAKLSEKPSGRKSNMQVWHSRSIFNNTAKKKKGKKFSGFSKCSYDMFRAIMTKFYYII